MKNSYALNLFGGFDGSDRAAADGRARVAARREDHRHRIFARQHRRSDFGEAAGRHRVQQFGEIALDQRHDRLALGIAEADIIFDELGSVGRKHQPGIKHAAKRRSCGGERPRRGEHDFVHRTFLQLRREHRCRRVGAHPTGIGTGIAFTDALMVLSRGQRHCGVAVHEREQARFLTLQKFFDHQRHHRPPRGSPPRLLPGSSPR